MRLGMAHISRSPKWRTAFAEPKWCPPSGGYGRHIAILAVILLTTISPAFAQQAASGFRVVPIVREDRVYVTFDLASGFTEDVRAAIQSWP